MNQQKGSSQQEPSKRTYASPTLQIYGSLAEVTMSVNKGATNTDAGKHNTR
jgi:hypothetical protein